MIKHALAVCLAPTCRMVPTGAHTAPYGAIVGGLVSGIPLIGKRSEEGGRGAPPRSVEYKGSPPLDSHRVWKSVGEFDE